MRILTVILMFLCPCAYSQLKAVDSVFVEINKLSSEKIYYGLLDAKINLVNISLKNRYQDQLGFIAGYSDSKFFLKKREAIREDKVVSYEKFNKMLNEDFMKIYYYYKIYFIISEDKDNYLTLDVRPILPPELNKQ